MRRLHEHAARSTGGVYHLAAGGFDDVDDGLHQADRGEELAVVVGLLVGELGQEVFIDPAKHVTVRALKGGVVENAQHLAQDRVVQFGVFLLGQQALEGFVIALDAFHRSDQGGRGALPFGQADQHVELGFWAKVDGAAAREVCLGQVAHDTATAGQSRDDLVSHLQEAGIGMAQEDQPHDGHEVFVAGEVGVRAKGVRRTPEAFFNIADLLQGAPLSILTVC